MARGGVEDARKYNPGDISPVTGLQKKADGSWGAVEKSGAKEKSPAQKYNSLMKQNRAKVQSLNGKPIKDVKTELKKMGYILEGHGGWEPSGSRRGLPEIEIYKDHNGNAKISMGPYVEQKES